MPPAQCLDTRPLVYQAAFRLTPFQKADQVSTAFSSVSLRSQTEALPPELEVRKSSP